MAVKFYLPDGSRTDIVAISLPCFFVRTPEDFLAFTEARSEPERLMPAFLEQHPEALPAIQAALGAEPPESYATVAYNSLHAYRWLDAGGGARHVRYRFEPEAGEHALARDEAKARGADYLQREITERSGAAFRLGHGRGGGRPAGRPDRGLAGGARAGGGGPARADRSGNRARAGRRHPGVRPHPGDRRDRADRRPDPALPAARLLGLGRSADRRPRPARARRPPARRACRPRSPRPGR